MNLFDEATAAEIIALQKLLDCSLPEALLRMAGVDDMRLYVWRAWVAARHAGQDVTLETVAELPYIQLLQAQAEPVTDNAEAVPDGVPT